MEYKVKLPVFEGPLDLLFYLIKKEELDIYDIPIAKITDQYLEYIEMFKLLDLNVAGEFIVMAATLMHIKSRLLLPQEEGMEELVEEDPRAELVRRLIEYKKFKDAASSLADMEKKQKDVYPVQGEIEKEKMCFSDNEEGFEANIFDLITAFVKVVKTYSKEDFHKVMQDEFTVSQKMHDLYHLLVARPVVCFTDLFRKAKNRLEAITIFLALLELIRLNEVQVRQRESFDEIEIVRVIAPIREKETEGVPVSTEESRAAQDAESLRDADAQGKQEADTITTEESGSGQEATLAEQSIREEAIERGQEPASVPVEEEDDEQETTTGQNPERKEGVSDDGNEY